MWRVQVLIVVFILFTGCMVTAPYANVSKAGSMDARCLPYITSQRSLTEVTPEAQACADYTSGRLSAIGAVNAHFPVTMPPWVTALIILACALVLFGLGSFRLAFSGVILMLLAFFANIKAAMGQL